MNENDKEYYSNLARQLAQTQNYPGVVGAVGAMAENEYTSSTPAKRIEKIIFFCLHFMRRLGNSRPNYIYFNFTGWGGILPCRANP